MLLCLQLLREHVDPLVAPHLLTSRTGSSAASTNLAPRWHDWREVRAVCRELAAVMVEVEV
jgi:hypothetical protein